MTKSEKESVQEIIDSVKRKSGVLGVMAITRSGFLVCCESDIDMDVKTLGIILTTMTGASESAMDKLKIGHLKKITAQGDGTSLVVMHAGAGAILAAVVKQSADESTVLEAMRTACDKIGKEIK